MECRTILRLIGLLVACGFVASAARAQSDDWARVKELPAGAVIYVSSEHGQKCIFQAASDDVLVCAAGSRELILKKKDVRQVRIDRESQVLPAIAGLAAVAASAQSPFGDGIARDPQSAAQVGASVSGTPGVRLPFLPKRLVYQRK